MPLPTTTLRINGRVHGKIRMRPKGLIFALCDQKGLHVTVTRKSETAFHLEVSSNQTLRSVWDEARLGIAAKGMRWPNADRHANYITNREIALPLSLDPWHVIGFQRPVDPPRDKASYARFPSIELLSRDEWTSLDVMLSCRNDVESETSAQYPLGWINMIFQVK